MNIIKKAEFFSKVRELFRLLRGVSDEVGGVMFLGDEPVEEIVFRPKSGAVIIKTASGNVVRIEVGMEADSSVRYVARRPQGVAREGWFKDRNHGQETIYL